MSAIPIDFLVWRGEKIAPAAYLHKLRKYPFENESDCFGALSLLVMHLTYKPPLIPPIQKVLTETLHWMSTNDGIWKSAIYNFAIADAPAWKGIGWNQQELLEIYPIIEKHFLPLRKCYEKQEIDTDLDKKTYAPSKPKRHIGGIL